MGEKISKASIKDPIEAVLNALYVAARKKESILVFDNLEAIVDSQELMDELGNLIIFLDDDTYAKYKVKMLIVGVPGEVKEYFQKVKNLRTVANRLYEIPEVTRMTPQECDKLVELLGELASADEPILRRGVGSGKYRFIDARYRMCLRVMLRKSSDEQVTLSSKA